MEEQDPTECDICKKAITGSWVTIHDGKTGDRIEARCSPCDDQKRREQFGKDNRISTRLLMKATLNQALKQLEDGDQAIIVQYERLQPEVARFQKDVWFGGLADIARNAKTKGTSATVGDFKLLCYTMCGRAMITLDDPKASLTLITAEDAAPGESGMGVQGIDATGDQAMELLRRAMMIWADGVRVTEDREVRIAGT